MEPQFKYYGRDVDPDRKLISTGEPITQEQKNENDLKTFRALFRNEVRKAVQKTAITSHGLYARLAPQEGAFDHLMIFLDAAGYELNEITLSSNKNDDALYKVQIAIPITKEVMEKAFTQPISETAEACAFVSFHIGVSAEATALVRKNALIETALEECYQAMHVDPQTIEMFNPENLIPDLIKALRGEQRYRYLSTFTAEVAKDFYYKTPEGFVYRIEIDGYAAAEKIDSIDTVG